MIPLRSIPTLAIAIAALAFAAWAEITKAEQANLLAAAPSADHAASVVVFADGFASDHRS